jgi:hypothetical protein
MALLKGAIGFAAFAVAAFFCWLLGGLFLTPPEAIPGYRLLAGGAFLICVFGLGGGTLRLFHAVGSLMFDWISESLQERRRRRN